MKITDQLHAFTWKSTAANNCNTYLINGPERILIDPGHLVHFNHVEKGLEEIGISLDEIELVICTHAHPDHFEGVQALKKTKAKFAMHHKEWYLAKAMGKQLSSSGIDLESCTPDFLLREGDFSINGMAFNIYHTPGHSPGSISILWPEQKALFTGDLIFKDGLGRTDLPGGNSQQLKQSINNLSLLDTDFLLPGHGDVILNAKDVKANFKQIKNVWFNYL